MVGGFYMPSDSQPGHATGKKAGGTQGISLCIVIVTIMAFTTCHRVYILNPKPLARILAESESHHSIYRDPPKMVSDFPLIPPVPSSKFSGSCEKASLWHKALGFFAAMPTATVQPTTLSLKIAVAACATQRTRPRDAAKNL